MTPELETVWSGDRGVYIGSGLREMDGYGLTFPPKGASVPSVELPDLTEAKAQAAEENGFYGQIDAFIKQHPGLTVSGIAAGMGLSKRSEYFRLHSAITRLVARQILRVDGVAKDTDGKGGRPGRQYVSVPMCERPPKRRTPNDLYDHVREVFVSGMTVVDVAKAIGATRWQACRPLRRLVREGYLFVAYSRGKWRYFKVGQACVE